MTRREDIPFDKRALHRSFAAGTLKVCPVCGTLNLEEAYECFVCTWFGQFEDDPEMVKQKLTELVASSPALITMLHEECSPMSRLRQFMQRVWRRITGRLDVWV